MSIKFDGLGKAIGVGVLGCITLMPLAAHAQMDFMNKLNQLKGQVEKDLGAASKSDSEKSGSDGQLTHKAPTELQSASAAPTTALSDFDIKGIKLGMTQAQVSKILKTESDNMCSNTKGYILCGPGGAPGKFSFFGSGRFAQFEFGGSAQPEILIRAQVTVNMSERANLLSAYKEKFGRAPEDGFKIINGAKIGTSIWKDQHGNIFEVVSDATVRMELASYGDIQSNQREQAERDKERAKSAEANRKKSDI